MNFSSDRERILVVDDEPLNLKVIREVLHEQYRLSFAKSADAALKLIDKEKRIDPLWYITLGKWNKDIAEHENTLNNNEFKKIITYFHQATEIDEQNNLAWHYYALAKITACRGLAVMFFVFFNIIEK